MAELLSNPASLFAMTGLFALTSGCIFLRKIRLTTQMLVCVALMLAIILCIGEGKKTHENIEKRKAFTIALVNRELMGAADYFGTVSGYREPGKWMPQKLGCCFMIPSATAIGH